MKRGTEVSRMRFLLAIPLAVLVAAAVLLAWGQGSAEKAEAGGVGMNLTAPANVLVGQTFMVTISATGSPTNMSGYATEILLPVGLQWIPRASCPLEVLARYDNTSNGGSATSNPQLCTRNNAPPPVAGTDPRHVAGTEVAAPPLLPFNTLGNLVQVDVQCVSAGTHQVTLTAAPDSAFGAIYFDTATNQVTVQTVPKDVDGDTTPENVADFQNVNCTVPPPTNTPSNTPTRTPTRTPTPTFTPCQVQGATCTPTPTNTPSPTNTPLPPGAEVVLSGPSEAPVGGAIDVTANLSDDSGPLADVDCTFTIVSAPDGSDASLATDTATTDEGGDATVSLSVGNVAGTISVQADCGGVASQVLDVTVIGGVGPPPTGANDGSAGSSIALWAILGVALAAALAGMGFAGWRKVAQAR